MTLNPNWRYDADYEGERIEIKTSVYHVERKARGDRTMWFWKGWRFRTKKHQLKNSDSHVLICLNALGELEKAYKVPSWVLPQRVTLRLHVTNKNWDEFLVFPEKQQKPIKTPFGFTEEQQDEIDLHDEQQEYESNEFGRTIGGSNL